MAITVPLAVHVVCPECLCDMLVSATAHSLITETFYYSCLKCGRSAILKFPIGG